jgi:hypothetical protein
VADRIVLTFDWANGDTWQQLFGSGKGGKEVIMGVVSVHIVTREGNFIRKSQHNAGERSVSKLKGKKPNNKFML